MLSFLIVTYNDFIFLVELISEIKVLSSKNQRILEKIKSHNIPEVLQTLPKVLFNIENFSSLTSTEIHDFDVKKAEKLKTKAFQAFDSLMNEEVLLERIHSKCVFINQSSIHQETYRKKAINHLTVDLIPSFLPYTQKKYAKFLKNSNKLVQDMKLQKKQKNVKKSNMENNENISIEKNKENTESKSSKTRNVSFK